MKKCITCGADKPLSEYYKHNRMKDGHLNKCKPCVKAAVSKNYRAIIDHYKEYERGRANLPHRVDARADYAKSEAGIASGNTAKNKWAKRNPVKRLASYMVNNAVRDGKLLKPEDCEGCGSKPSRLHGHHDDYAYPLIVRWLCPGCHNKWHKDNGEGLNAS